MAIKLVTLPSTEFGMKLECNGSEELRVVYRPSERNPDFYIYHSLWNPEEDYLDGYIAVPFGSVFRGTQAFAAGTFFANVEGSSKDHAPAPYRSWRQLMINTIPNWNTCCAETDTIYSSATGQRDMCFQCTCGGNEDLENRKLMQGAHVLMNEMASRRLPEGSDVYVLPLCIKHNVYGGITGKTGTGYFMKLRRAQEVTVLTGFIPSNTIHNAILEEELEMQSLQTTEKPQLSVGLEFTFMGVDLGAFYKKKNDVHQIFVAPMSVDNRAELTLSEMIKQFNELAGTGVLSEDDVKRKIETDKNNDTAVNLDWKTIKFCLKMLFLNIEIGANEKAKSIEYALSLQIIADGLIPDEIEVFNIKSLTFNIWNTERQSVLDKMALSTPEIF